jgi:drug/metabolite transporter (DMT)-like permease
MHPTGRDKIIAMLLCCARRRPDTKIEHLDQVPLIQPQTPRRAGLILLLICLVAISPDALLVRLMQAQHSPAISPGAPYVIATWKCLALGLLSLMAAAWLEGGCGRLLHSLCLVPRHAFLATGFQAASQVGFTLSFLWTDPAAALLLISLNPLWAALMGWAFLGDALKPRTVAALVMASLSVGVVFLPTLLSTGAPIPLAGVLVSLGTGFSAACYMTAVRAALLNDPRAGMAACSGLGALVASVAAALIATSVESTPLMAGLKTSFWGFCVLDASCIGIFYICLTLALRSLSGTEVALVLLLQIVLAPTLVFLGTGEAPSMWTVAGGILLIMVLAAHELPSSPRITA